MFQGITALSKFFTIIFGFFIAGKRLCIHCECTRRFNYGLRQKFRKPDSQNRDFQCVFFCFLIDMAAPIANYWHLLWSPLYSKSTFGIIKKCTIRTTNNFCPCWNLTIVKNVFRRKKKFLKLFFHNFFTRKFSQKAFKSLRWCLCNL